MSFHRYVLVCLLTGITIQHLWSQGVRSGYVHLFDQVARGLYKGLAIDR